MDLLPRRPPSVDPVTMAETLALLTLDLRRPLLFPEPLASTAGPLVLASKECGEEGDELLFALPEDLVVEGPDGPRCTGRVDGPLQAWARREAGISGKGEEVGAGFRLAEGHWHFMQWRPGDGVELLEGVEWFARELWWEDRAAEGALFLRVVREEGKLAWQLLRREAKAQGRPRP